MKRAGLLLVIACAGILGIELALSVLRQRVIAVEVRPEGPLPAVEVQTQPGNGAAIPEVGAEGVGSVRIAPEGGVSVDITWTYRIGPRFPVTTIRAEIVDDQGQTVASEAYTFECVGDSLNCAGQRAFTLRYGVREGQGAAQPWPVGSYSLQVTRTYQGARAERLTVRPVQVIDSRG